MKLFNDVRIVFNWYLGCIILMNLNWIDLVSLIFIVSIWNYCSWPHIRALWCWIGWFAINLRFWGWSGGMLPYYLYFDVVYTSIMFLLVWYTYGGGVVFFTYNWCGLVGITLCNMTIMALSALLQAMFIFVYLIMWIMMIYIYILSNVKIYVF